MAEFYEYKEYLSKNPTHGDRSEIQNAQFMQMVNSFMGSKNKIEDFLVSAKFKTKKAAVNIADQVKAVFGGYLNG